MKEKPIDFMDAEGNRIGTLDASAPADDVDAPTLEHVAAAIRARGQA